MPKTPKTSKSEKPSKGKTGPADRTYDAIVVGGGHNGLTNGAYLAKAGLKTLILERRRLVGGAAITEELYPGFWFTTFSYALSLLRPDIIHDLELTKHGFMPLLMSSTFAPMENGDYLLLGQDHGENLQEIARHSKHDADAYDRYDARHGDGLPGDQAAARRGAAGHLQRRPARSCVALAALGSRFRRLDKKDAPRRGPAADRQRRRLPRRLLRVATSSRATIASSAIIGTKVGPMSQGSGLVLLYHIDRRARRRVRRVGASTRAATAASPRCSHARRESFGAEIRLESPVDHVITKDGRATGVALDGRHRVPRPDRGQRARPAADVPRAGRPARAADATSSRRSSASASRAPRPRSTSPSTALPRYPALGDRTDQYRGFTNIGPSMEYLERAFDDAKYGWYSQRPYIDCAIQSTIDPDMAPPGKHVMSCFVQYAPYKLRESDWDTERQNLGDTVQATLESFFPGFGDLVLHREVVTPLDIERTVGLSEGNIFAGEFLAPQMYFFRPAPGWSQYRTPIDGYYQCGSGTHPGGCVMGAPGKLAAERILKDRARA